MSHRHNFIDKLLICLTDPLLKSFKISMQHLPLTLLSTSKKKALMTYSQQAIYKRKQCDTRCI